MKIQKLGGTAVMHVIRRVFFATLSVICGCALFPVGAKAGWDLQSDVKQREAAGDLNGARQLLEGQSSPAGARAYAEFLDRHHDAGARQAYLKWISLETNSDQRKAALRQLVLNDSLRDQTNDFTSDLAQYRAAGGVDLNESPRRAAAPAVPSTISIPGPLPSFARMAALSIDLAPEELLPAFARNVVTNGYEASGNESLQQTEYLRLVVRYLGQARELQAMAGSGRRIVVPSCDSEETANLLKIVGYRMRGSCGGDIVLETVNPTRAFLTVDSGFPISHLEAELRANHRFELPYAPTQVPVLYTPDYWMQALGRNSAGDFIDVFLSDPSLCRLYLGLSHLNRATAEALRKQAQPTRLKAYANVLDFYGAMFDVRNGAAVVPGSQRAWATLVGVSPANAGAFYDKLLVTDDGWGASYFDALSRIEGPVAAYLTQPERLKRFYDAVRGKVTSPGPARPVFRSSTELMLLTTSLRLQNGQIHIPGGVEVWKTLFVKHPRGKYDAKLTRAAGNWRTSDDLLEALFALSRKTVENEPLRIFLALNDIDRNRQRAISPELATRLINAYRPYGAQYNLFADAPGLSEAAIGRYLDTCADVNSIHDGMLRSDTAGILQASVELWRVFVVRSEIKPDAEDASFQKLITPFAHLRQYTDLFDAGRTSIDTVITTAGSSSFTGPRQQKLVELLVGPLRNQEGEALTSPANYFLRIYDAQRLMSLDTLFTMASLKGAPDPKLLKTVNEQLDRMAEIDQARSSLSTEERNAFSSGYWSSRHIDVERKFNLDKILKNPDRKDMREALAPFLRDAMLGFVYCYYAPAGAQLLLTNPSLVRNHDFIGPENAPSLWRNTEVAGTGWPASAGGRLTGSLITIPYAIAEAEQNFLSPRREQALIWADLVPQMIANVTIPRWSAARSEQLRWISLHMQRGRNLVAAAALDPALETKVLESYGRFATPARVEWLSDHLHSGKMSDAIAEVPPATLYALAQDPALKPASPDIASLQITDLAGQNLPSLSTMTIGRVFGSPKPTLTHSYLPGLLHLRTFPALMGYSSRILAESWESNSLYYAALADELAIPVNQLDTYIPEWNRATIENIFATHLEDWPAILRSLHTTSANVRQKSMGPMASSISEN